jgi:hypothetical protein
MAIYLKGSSRMTEKREVNTLLFYTILPYGNKKREIPFRISLVFLKIVLFCSAGIVKKAPVAGTLRRPELRQAARVVELPLNTAATINSLKKQYGRAIECFSK